MKPVSVEYRVWHRRRWQRWGVSHYIQRRGMAVNRLRLVLTPDRRWERVEDVRVFVRDVGPWRELDVDEFRGGS